MRQLILDIRPDAPPSLGNYLPGANAEAHHALCAVADGRPTEAVIYLWGPAGAGKTHLLRAVTASAQALGRPAHYVAAGEPLPDAPCTLLAVDDVQALDETGQIALFDRINRAREGKGVVVAAGDAAPTRLPLRADLTSRLSWGLVFALRPLSDEDKLMAMVERARARGMDLPLEVARHLLSHCRRDLPNLLALVDALDDHSLSLKRPVSLALLRSMLKAD
jgi:DnaA family protein